MEPLHPGVLSVVILLLAVFQPVAECKVVIVGDQFKFPVNCKPGDSVTLCKVTDDGALQVATYQSGVWTVTAEYRDRMIATSSGLVFTRTQYIDGGTYELSCSGREEKPVQLEVVVASERFVTEGETAVLPCYYNADVWWWEKNGKPLCNSNSDSGCNRTSAGRRYGNLSLILENARLEDSGDYFCYFQDQHGEPRTPVAVRLTVTKKKLHPAPFASTAAPENETPSGPEQTNPWMISTLVLGGLLILLIIAALCFFYVMVNFAVKSTSW